MNEIETMFWKGVKEYFKTFNSDTFLFENPFEQSTQIQVSYTNYDSGIEECDDGNITETPSSVCINIKGKHPDFHTTPFPNHVVLMMGNCKHWNHTIGNYKPDFMFVIASDYSLNFAIEIDGFDYHDKTKEQAAKDKQRDRFFTRNGFIPIRFAGTEVYRSPVDCVRETMQIILSILTYRVKSENFIESFTWYKAEEYFKNNKEALDE